MTWILVNRNLKSNGNLLLAKFNVTSYISILYNNLYLLYFLLFFVRYKDDKPLPKSNKLTTKTNVNEELVSLEISEATSADAGTYKVIATNALGKVESTCMVTVNSKL